MKCWRNFDDGVPSRRKILCLHGWLDNAASFDRLAPLLLRSLSRGSDDDDDDDHDADDATEIIALDFPGHGLSGHKSPDGPPQLLAEYAYYVVEFFDAVGWGSPFEESTTSTAGTSTAARDKVIVIGHSMGAGVAVVLGASFPEWCASLVLLEGAGPLARNADDAPRHVRAACRRRIRSNRLLFPDDGGGGASSSSSASSSRAKIYENVDAAIEARLDTARRMPGDQYLSAEAARDMVLRATVPATPTDPSTSSPTDPSFDPSTPVAFRHDPRLQWPSLQYYTREQVESFYRQVAHPVCLLTAEDGWPVDARAEEAVREVLRPDCAERLKGSHHFHADPDTVGEVVERVRKFLGEWGV